MKWPKPRPKIDYREVGELWSVGGVCTVTVECSKSVRECGAKEGDSPVGTLYDGFCY